MSENKSKSIQVIENEMEPTLSSFNSIIEIANENIPLMIQKAQRAEIALSKYQQINDDETDAEAEAILVKARKTYESIVAMRKEMTDVTDKFKKMAMMPEKVISTLAGDPESEYNRVKKLRDGYANIKFKRQQEEQERIKKEKAHLDEIIRLKSELEKRAKELIVDNVTLFESSISSFISKLTYETFETNVAKLNATPKLKPEIYERIFQIGRNEQAISVEAFNSLINEVKKIWTYEIINEQYVNQALLKLDAHKEKLPKLREELKAIYDAEQNDKANADKLKREKEEKERAEEEKRKADAELKKEQERNEIESKMLDQKLDNDFNAQVQEQSIEGTSGTVRKSKHAVITAPSTKIVQVIAQVIHTCFMNPEFKGYIKKDKEGKQIINDGIPEYEDWLNDLLTFYTKKCDTKIDGIEIRERVSAVNKK